MKNILLTIILFSVFILATPQYPVLAQNLPTVPSLQARLEDQIQKMIAAGHLRTTFAFGLDQRYRKNSAPDGTTNTEVVVQEFDDLFHNPADTIYTLAVAYPHVGSTLQTSLKSYMQSEFNTYKPYAFDHMGSAGIPREYNDVPTELRGSYQSSYNIETASPKNLPDYAGWNFNPFNFYALFKYAQVMGNASEVVNLMSQNGHSVPGNLPADSYLKSSPHVLNSYIAGYYGYLGLCNLQGAGCPAGNVTSVQSQLNSALAKKVQMLPANDQDILNMTVFEAGGFLWLVPELGNYLNQNALQKTQTAVAAFEKAVPYWMIPKAEESSRLRTNIYNEGSLSHMYDTSSAFLAKAYALKMSQAQLEQYLQGPGFEKGDLFYIQNLVATIEANPAGAVPTSPPQPTIPGGGKPGDANADNKVDGIDYVIWLNNYNKNATGVSLGDFNGNGFVDGVDYVIWLNNYGK